MTSPYDVQRARGREEKLARAARALPVEIKRQVMAAIDAHAPELRELIRQTGAVPIELSVRDGNGVRTVLSPEIIWQHTEEKPE